MRANLLQKYIAFVVWIFDSNVSCKSIRQLSVVCARKYGIVLITEHKHVHKDSFLGFQFASKSYLCIRCRNKFVGCVHRKCCRTNSGGVVYLEFTTTTKFTYAWLNDCRWCRSESAVCLPHTPDWSLSTVLCNPIRKLYTFYTALTSLASIYSSAMHYSLQIITIF